MKNHMSQKANKDFADMNKYDFCSTDQDKFVYRYLELDKEHDYDPNFLEDEQDIKDIDEVPIEDSEDDEYNENNDKVQIIPTFSRRLSGVQR
jgi:hypothetical protein